MSKARDQILARLRTHEGMSYPTADFAVINEKQWSVDERIQHLKSTMESVHTEVHLVKKDQLQTCIQGLIEQKQIKRLCYAPTTDLGQQVGQMWSDGSAPELVAYAEEIEHWKEELFFNVDASITTTLGGIVETGTLILWPSVEEPRLMSLVPPIHIVVLNASQVFNTLREAMIEQNWIGNMPTNALLISGPSKTADIEQTLAYGVHGPKELVVIVVQD